MVKESHKLAIFAQKRQSPTVSIERRYKRQIDF